MDIYEDEIKSTRMMNKYYIVDLITYMLKILHDDENEVLTDDIYKFVMNEDIISSYMIQIIELINDKSLDKIHKYYVPANEGYEVAKEHYAELLNKG